MKNYSKKGLQCKEEWKDGKNYNVTIEGQEELQCYNRRTGRITMLQ